MLRVVVLGMLMLAAPFASAYWRGECGGTPDFQTVCDPVCRPSPNLPLDCALRELGLVSDLPCDVRREGGKSLVIGGSSLVMLKGKVCNPL